MSPIRSTLAKSVAKLLSFAQEADIGLVKGRGKGNAERRPSKWSASGGTKIESGGYTYHVFTVDTPAPESSLVIDAIRTTKPAMVFAVGGGGSGGRDDGGGGGAGSAVLDPSITLGGEVTYAVTVGAGGAVVGNPSGSGGGNTELGSVLQAHGGAAGNKSRPSSDNASGAFDGGSGGGGAYPQTYPFPKGDPDFLPPNATSYQNDGGAGGHPSAEGGGGGGAGGNGSGAHPGPGAGGPGRAFPEFPAPLIAPALPSPEQSNFTSAVGTPGLFAGGGGGGGRFGETSGGPGGGGPGGYPGRSTGTAGVYGTGSGGGGTGAGGGAGGAAGGSGILIVRYTT